MEVGYYLGIGISNLLNTLAPEAIVLGGVSQGWDLIAPSLLNTISKTNGLYQ